MAFKAAAVAPVAHLAFTTAAAPTSPMDLAGGAAQAVSAQAVAEPPLLAIKEGCGLGDHNAADGQHVEPVSAGDASHATPAQAAPAQSALAQAAAAPPPPAIKEGCGLGLGYPDPDISGGSSLLATAGGSLYAAAEGLEGAVLIAQLVAIGVAMAQRYQPRMPGYAEVPLWAMVTSAFFAVCATQFIVNDTS